MTSTTSEMPSQYRVPKLLMYLSGIYIGNHVSEVSATPMTPERAQNLERFPIRQ